MAIEVVIEGMDELQRKLERIGAGAPHIMAAAIRAGAAEITAGIRSEIQSPYAHLRPVVKHSVRRDRDRYIAKSGLGVGRPVVPQRRHAHKGGRGLTSRNIHWAALGTAERLTRAGASRGAMPPILDGVVERGFAKSQGRATQAIIETARDRVHKLAETK